MDNAIRSIVKRPDRPGGCPLLTRVQSSAKPGLDARCRLLRDTNESKMRVAVSWANTLYLGSELTDRNPLTRSFLVARNRLSGRIRLIEVASACLKPSVRSAETQQQISETAETDEQQAHLSEKFGSKKQKRKFEQSKRHKIDVDTLKDQLETSALGLNVSDVMNKSANAISEDSHDRYIPPIDRDATDPYDVYKLDTILSSEEKLSLQSTAQSILADGPESVDLFDYIKEYISTIRASDDMFKENSCIALLYADSILKYLLADYKRACSTSFVACSYSNTINSNVLNNFSIRTDKARTRPQSMKDKAICYTIVLLLIASKLTIVNCEKLQKTLGITLTKLSQLVKVVGARIINNENTSKIVLKLPLVKPPEGRVKRGKR